MITLRDQIHSLVNSLDGWTTIEKADALCDLVLKTKPKLIMEVGVWAGKSLFSMALPAKANGNGCIILAVDPWSATDSATGQVDQASEEWWSKVDHNSIFNKFRWQVDKLDLNEMVEIHRVKSTDMAPIRDLDILHIDGNHGPDAITDVERLVPGVKLGGYVIMDDLRWAGGYVALAEKAMLKLGFHKVSGTEDWGIYKRIEMGAPKVAETASDPRSPLPTMEQVLDSQLTVALITSRENPLIEWFLDSLANTGFTGKVLIIDLHASEHAAQEVQRAARGEPFKKYPFREIKHTSPKPNVWQGEHRLTSEDWWAVSNARNTAICLCSTEWLACFDDRCVIMPGWLEAVRDAMKGNYVLCGSYQKRVEMKVENGLIVHGGTVTGEDTRFLRYPSGVVDAPGEWTFGCNFAVPIEWALEVNGFDELFDGMGFEDCFFGKMLMNCGHPIKFDARARVIQDRTPAELGTSMARMDKGVSPDDKSHAAVKKFSPLKRTLHPWDLRNIRKHVLNGGAFPKPRDIDSGYWKDWYDGQPISEFKRP